MKIGIISASNVSTSGKNSVSLKTCELVKLKLMENYENADIEIIDLRDYSFLPCDMCEGCSGTLNCIKDNDFNTLWNELKKMDGLIIVCPHYAAIPSKLVIIMEKIQELCYLQYCTGSKETFVLKGKKAGIIAHGGMVENYEEIYNENIIKPLTNMLRAIGMNPVNTVSDNALCFGVKGFSKSSSRITPDIIHDFENIEAIADRLIELYI